MMNQTAPVMLINLATCTNVEEAKAIMGLQWESGFKAVASTKLEPNDGPMDIWCIALPGQSVHKRAYRKIAHILGLLSKDNLGPLLIEGDGCIYMTSAAEASPRTFCVGYLGVGPGLCNIDVELGDGETKTYNIDFNVDEKDRAGCWVDC